jgi:hypothetical protein
MVSRSNRREVRTEAEKALYSVQSRLSTGEMVGRVFSGISLGSILLLAAPVWPSPMD